MSSLLVPRRAALVGGATLGIGLLAMRAAAAPQVGSSFPAFRATNLDGQEKTESDLKGRQTLVVVVTGTGAADAMAEWVREAQRRYPDRTLRRVVLLALDLAAIVPTFLVRDKAKGKVPRAYWKDTFVDAHGKLAAQLGVTTGDSKPLVYVLDPGGRVKVSVRGELSAKTGASVWAAVAAP